MDDLNKERFNGDISLNNLKDDEENIDNRKKKLLKEVGDFIFSVLKYFENMYKSTDNKILKELFVKYIAWYKIFLFNHQMNLLYNEIPLINSENEFNTNISDDFRQIYREVMANKHEYLDKNKILNRNNTKADYEDYVGLWCKSFEIENRDILEKRKDTYNFYFSDDTSIFYMKISEKVDFKEDELNEEFEMDEEEEEVRGRSKTRSNKNFKISGNNSKSSSKSKSESISKSRSHSCSRSRSASCGKYSEKGKEKKNKTSKNNKMPRRISKKFEYTKLRDPLPYEKKLNEVSYVIMKMLLYWKSDKDRLYVMLKALPSFTDININYRHGKNHTTLTTYGYTILSIIYISLDLISLREGMTIFNEKVESLKENGKVIICQAFENIEIDNIVTNINEKHIAIKYIIYLWQILFQLMEWSLFLKISQIIQRYYEIYNDNEDAEYKELFHLEWNVYINIANYLLNVEKKDNDRKDENKKDDNKKRNSNPNGRRFSGFLRGLNFTHKENKKTNNKSIIENAFDIKLFDNLKNDVTEEELEITISNLKFGVHTLYNYIKFAIENQMGCIFNINTFIRIIWHYCIRLFPENQNFKCICNKNVIVIVKLIIICIDLYRKYYYSYINPVMYCKIIQQYILITLNNNYDYDANEVIKRIKVNIKNIDACLYSARGTSHIYHSLSYNPSVFGSQFEYMTLSASKSPKKKEIIHSLIHKKYVMYSLMFRIAILDKRKEYYIEKRKKEKEYFDVYKKKLTSYPEFMSKPTPSILDTYCGKNNYLKSLFHLQFTIALKDYLTKSQKESLLFSALSYLQTTHSEESILIKHAYLNSENMHNNIDRNICPPPICIKRNNNSLVFKPLPPRNKNIKPFYYKIFCKSSDIGNVTLSDCSYTGTDEFILNKKNETEIIISGLTENQKYIVAVAAYDENKNLLCGRIGAQTTPILVAYPLPLLINLSYLGQYSSTEGIENCTPCFEHCLFDYFVESLCDESSLIYPFSKESYWIKKVII